jgi:peptidoglycan/xylan/chitin deacetylase (PgdA/CDA1 family)
MNLSIGLLSNSLIWEMLLQQMGVSYRKIDRTIPDDLFKFAVVISDDEVCQSQEITKYLESGGLAILGCRTAKSILGSGYRRKMIRSLSAKGKPFQELGIIDFYTMFHLFNDERLTDFSKEFFIRKLCLGKGSALILPFSLKNALSDTRSRRKRFWSDQEEKPSEIVSLVSKGKIRRLLEICLSDLFSKGNLPFIKLSAIPKPPQNLFLFRIDTDFCSAEQANDLYSLCLKYNIRASWFVDTVSENRLQEVYAKMSEQEIGLHCHQHLIHTDYGRNRENIAEGLQRLKKAGISPEGFAAPFGDWNESLHKVLQEFEFLYSSEFALNYDDLPYLPVLNNSRSAVLQIPVHPISIGRLRRSHFSEQDMISYFQNYITIQMQKGEPAIIYHHPSHGYLTVIEKIFRCLKTLNFQNITFSQYAHWWKNRKILNPEFAGDIIELNHLANDGYVDIQHQKKLSIQNIQSRIHLSRLNWAEPSYPDNPETMKLRRFHWRDMLYNHESKKGKKYHANLPG